MPYESNIVQKPWGFEYLAYQNDDIGLWILHIAKDQSTSMHCHPTKTTGLILLQGEVDVVFLGNAVKLNPVDKLMIRRGLFHSTTALSDDGATILEIETPKDKQDLVRLGDKYGRVNTPYEDYKYEMPKNDSCLWISEEYMPYGCKKYGCEFVVEKVTDANTILRRNDNDLIVFLSGAIITDKKERVVIAGDVGFAKIVKKVVQTFSMFEENTVIMTIRRE